VCDVFSLAISNWSVGFCFEKFFELEHSRKKNFKVLFERWFYFFVMFSDMLITHSCGVSMTSSEVTNFACLQNLVGEFEILKPFNGDNYVTKN